MHICGWTVALLCLLNPTFATTLSLSTRAPSTTANLTSIDTIITSPKPAQKPLNPVEPRPYPAYPRMSYSTNYRKGNRRNSAGTQRRRAAQGNKLDRAIIGAIVIGSIFLFITLSITITVIIFCLKKNTVFVFQKSEQEDVNDCSFVDSMSYQSSLQAQFDTLQRHLRASVSGRTCTQHSACPCCPDSMEPPNRHVGPEAAPWHKLHEHSHVRPLFANIPSDGAYIEKTVTNASATVDIQITLSCIDNSRQVATTTSTANDDLCKAPFLPTARSKQKSGGRKSKEEKKTSPSLAISKKRPGSLNSPPIGLGKSATFTELKPLTRSRDPFTVGSPTSTETPGIQIPKSRSSYDSKTADVDI